MNLDLTGIVKLALDLGCDVACKKLHTVVGYDLGLNHDSYLTACRNCEGLLYALKVACNLLKLLETLNVIFNVLTTSAGTSRTDRVSCLNDEVKSTLSLNVVVMSLDSVDDVLIFTILLSCLNTKLNVRAVNSCCLPCSGSRRYQCGTSRCKT